MSVSPPSEPLLMWATTDTNLPNLAGPNKVKPIDDLIAKGWDFKQKPCADEFNYVLNNYSLWIDYVADLVESVIVNGAVGIAETAAKLAIARNITLRGGVTGTVGFDGSINVAMNTSVTDNSHNHVSANITDATSNNTADKIIKRDGNGSFAANEGYVNRLIINKVNGVSEIVFPSNNTDPAFIREVEVGADISHMRFSVSDNGNGEDKFVFGSTNDGVWTPKTVIDTAGNIDTEGTIVASGAITAPRFNGTASAADKAYPRRSDGASLNFHWNGQGGQPTWLWGGNDGVHMYVYNPSNFSVNYANSSNYANSAGSANTATNNVAVLSGTIGHGGWLPIPDGYQEWQCRFFISMNNTNPHDNIWDWREGLSTQHYSEYCRLINNRQVEAFTRVYHDVNDAFQYHNGIVNYIVVGVK